MIKNFFTIVILFLMSLPVNAQVEESEKTVLYVTDQLRLSLYSEANERSNVLLYLTSGDRLVVEEVSGPYAKVTAPSGRLGWVKRGFLVSEPTAVTQLAAMIETNEVLKQELEKLNNSKIVIDQYEQDMDSMSAQIEALKIENEAAEDTIKQLSIAAEELKQAEKQQPTLNVVKKIAIGYWQYLAGAAAFILILGFLFGKSITESAVRKKFHGVKVW